MGVQLWQPSQIWLGKPCYIVGGGPSLETFDWAALRGCNVLGCNAALYKGASLIPWVIFGDGSFLHQHGPGINRYVEEGGEVVTCANRFRRRAPEWLHVMPKQHHGLSRIKLGWNGNTGAAAINLALLFGADPIYLLGYDMQLNQKGQANFHNAYNHRPNARAYPRFLKGMMYLQRDLPVLFPGQRVINLEDNTSALTGFPKESLKEHGFKAMVAA